MATQVLGRYKRPGYKRPGSDIRDLSWFRCNFAILPPTCFEVVFPESDISLLDLRSKSILTNYNCIKIKRKLKQKKTSKTKLQY